MRNIAHCLVVAGIIQSARAGFWQRGVAKARSESFQASSFAGATTSAVFPPPGASDTDASIDSFFPTESEVGFAGPTPSA